VYNIIFIVREIVLIVREIVLIVSVREISMNKNAVPSPSPTSLRLFTFCFYIGKNTYQELVRMLYVLLASLDRFHPDFFLVVYHNLGITIDDPRVRMVGGGGVKGVGGADLLLEAEGCDGNVWVEGSAVRNRWYKLNFNRVHAFKNLYDEYDGSCFTWIDLDTIVVADLSYLREVDNYFIIHGGVSERTHDVLLGPGGDVIWSVPERMYIHGSFWKLNLSLYHEILRLDLMFRENGVRLKYDIQSIFSVMAWGGGGGGNRCPFYDGGGSMLVIGYNYRPDVMNGLGVWDTKNGVGNHVNMEALANMKWGGSVPLRRVPINEVWGCGVDIDRRLNLTPDDEGGSVPLRRVPINEVGGSVPIRRVPTNDGGGECGGGECGGGECGGILRTTVYPDKEIHILSLTFDSFFMSNVSGSADFARLFPFLGGSAGGSAPQRR
jgi:hypothetical protein